MELIKDFGIEPILLLAQIVNFIIIFLILKRYLYKPVLGILEKRKEEIKLGIKNAEDAQRLLAKTIEEEKNILKNAQAKAKIIIDEARDQASLLSQVAEARIKKNTENMIREAKEQISQEAKATENRIMLQVTKISIQMLEKSLTGFVGGRAQQEILEKTIKDLRKKSN